MVVCSNDLRRTIDDNPGSNKVQNTRVRSDFVSLFTLKATSCVVVGLPSYTGKQSGKLRTGSRVTNHSHMMAIVFLSLSNLAPVSIDSVRNKHRVTGLLFEQTS